MDNEVLEITPSTKIGDLLKAYPELEAVLLATAPPFKKLRNPFLRKGVARVASIRHVSSVGNVPLDARAHEVQGLLHLVPGGGRRREVVLPEKHGLESHPACSNRQGRLEKLSI